MPKKKVKKEKKLSKDELCANAAEYLDGWKRAQAELENNKKEEAKRNEDFRRYLKQVHYGKIIAILDSFDQALSSVSKEDAESDWTKGVQNIRKQFTSMFKEDGIEEYEAQVGDSFDPSLHEVIGEVVDRAHVDQVVQAAQKGFKMGETVIRPARVIVGKSEE